jgi:hypothetical protein
VRAFLQVTPAWRRLSEELTCVVCTGLLAKRKRRRTCEIRPLPQPPVKALFAAMAATRHLHRHYSRLSEAGRNKVAPFSM